MKKFKYDLVVDSEGELNVRSEDLRRQSFLHSHNTLNRLFSGAWHKFREDPEWASKSSRLHIPREFMQ